MIEVQCGYANLYTSWKIRQVMGVWSLKLSITGLMDRSAVDDVMTQYIMYES